MIELPPIDTPEQRLALRQSNRLALAERCRWPTGALEACDRLQQERTTWVAAWPKSALRLRWLDGDHLGWSVSWSDGRSEPPYSACWLGPDIVYVKHAGLPHGRPRVCAETLDELAEQMTALERRIISERVLAARLREDLGRARGRS